MTKPELRIAIDASVLVGLINPRDTWHQATALQDALQQAGCAPVYFDCVIAESLSAVLRRLYEKKRKEEIEILLTRFEEIFPPERLDWLFPDVPRLYGDILALIRQSGGELNFNDALIALACREREIEAIASFDADFDRIPWLHRVATPDSLSRGQAHEAS